MYIAEIKIHSETVSVYLMDQADLDKLVQFIKNKEVELISVYKKNIYLIDEIKSLIDKKEEYYGEMDKS